MNTTADLKTKLMYQCVGNKNSNHTLLFIHGAGGSSETLYDLAMQFTDYNCILIDLPGHGQSSQNIPDSIVEYFDTIEKFIDSESALLGNNITCIGHSMGGMITIELAARKLPQIKQIVILNSAANIKADKNFMAKVHKGILSKKYIFKACGSYFNPKTYKFLIKNSNQFSQQCMKKDFILLDHYDLSNRLKHISLPTLVVTGAKEILATPEDSKFLHENIQNSELEIMPDVAHLLPIISPEKLSKRILKFIKSNLSE